MIRSVCCGLATAIAGIAFCTFGSPSSAAEAVSNRSTQTEYVLWVTYDGLRWQEVFGGADERLINTESGGVKNVRATKDTYLRDSAEARREVLLPFFWDTIASEGQLIGDPDHDSSVQVTNGRYFSYPGYQEILAGFPDKRIASNAKLPNRNVTLLEWIHGRPGFSGRVAAFCSWDVFPFIINSERSGIPVNAGWDEVPLSDSSRSGVVNEIADELPHYWDNVRYDVLTFLGALDHLRNTRPRLLYVSFGETDDWAHAGRYDLYLDSALRTDRYIRRLWNAAQSTPEMAGKTSLVITTDHGRGDTRDGWKNHSVDLPGSEQIWIAMLGPDTPALGVRKGVQCTQSQVAATVAALLGEDYAGAVAKAGAVLDGALNDREGSESSD